MDNLGIACTRDPSYKEGQSPAASSLALVAVADFLETHLAPGTYEQVRLTYFKSWWECVVTVSVLGPLTRTGTSVSATEQRGCKRKERPSESGIKMEG